MAGSRTLKLSILADVDNLQKNLKVGEKEVEGFGGKLEKFGKVAAAAFAAAAAAAAAYAGKLAIEGVKAAIEDEAAQKRLATALENVTGATEAQIAAVEEQILKTSLATGVADDKLRPALQRLATSTGSVTKSQELLKLALDISAATGKDVETVSNALAKAYDGNNGALTRLGVGLTATEAKTLGFDGAVSQLSKTFGGAALTQANTFEGQISRLKVTFDEAKESLGTALLPLLQTFLNYIVNTAIPKFKELKTAALDPILKAFNDNKESLTLLGNVIKEFVVPIFLNGLGNAIKFIGKVAGGVLDIIGAVVRGVQGAITIAINAINVLIGLYNNTIGRLPGVPDIKKIGVPNFNSGSKSNTSSNASIPKTPNISLPSSPNLGLGSSGNGSSSGSGSGSGSGSSKSQIPNLNLGNYTQTVRDFIGFKPQYDGAFQGRGNTRPDDGGGVTIVVQAPSVIDEEGFSRAVVDALNQATNRGTGGGGGLRDTAQIL